MPLKSNRLKTALAGLLLLPLVAFGQAGFINRPIAAGQMDLLSVPFIVTGGNTVSNIFPTLPAGSVFYFWDDTLNTWTPVFGSSKDWAPIGSRQVLPG